MIFYPSPRPPLTKLTPRTPPKVKSWIRHWRIFNDRPGMTQAVFKTFKIPANKQTSKGINLYFLYPLFFHHGKKLLENKKTGLEQGKTP